MVTFKRFSSDSKFYILLVGLAESKVKSINQYIKSCTKKAEPNRPAVDWNTADEGQQISTQVHQLD